MRQFKPGQLQTGSIYPITASYALTASYLSSSISIDTGSLVTTSSFNAFTASYTTGSFTGSFIGDGSQLTGIVSSKWTGSNPISRQSDVEITGSLRITGQAASTLLTIGTNTLVVTGSRIGIGTTTPVDAVEIVGPSKYIKINGVTDTDRSAWIGNDAVGTGNVYLFNGTNSNTVFLTGNGSSFFNGGNVGIGIGQASISASLHISGTNASNLFRIDSPGSSSILFVTGSGNVGIGTLTPTQKLHVNGNINLSAGSDKFVRIGSSTNYWYDLQSTGDNFQIIDGNGTPRFVLRYSVGSVGIGVTLPSAKLHVNNTSSGNSFLVEDSTNVDNTPFVIDADGNTGIGILTPNAKLNVSGSAIITGSLTVTQDITGSLHGTASWATNAITASYITASGVYGPYGANSVTSASYAATASYSENIQISGSVNNVDYIDFNTGSAVPAWKSGRVFWDNTDGALAVYNAEADITLQVGQENWTRVSNRTGTTITNGTVVRLIGAHGDVPEVERAQSLLVSGSVNVLNQILGVATHDIEDNSKGFVTTQGLVRGLNTSAFNDGDTLFVGTGSSGVLQNTVPVAPYEIIPVGVCVKAGPGGSGMIYVAVQEPIDFSDLSSVLVEGIYHYGDLWTYVQSGSTGVWTHTNQLSGSYGLTGSLTATSFTGSLLGTASWANNAVTASYVLNAVSSSYASVANSVNDLNQNVYISGSLVVNGPSTFYGTASFVSVTASNLYISESFISVNVFEPVERFGGLKVYDSGSSTATASLAWDSLHNHWVYQNVDGLTYTGGMLLSGPRNTGSLGDEPNLTKWFVPRSDGGDHLDNSQIFTSGSITQITGSLTVTAGVTASFTGSYAGDGSGLYNIPASGIVGLNLSQIASGSVSASISPNAGLQINTNVTATSFTGSLLGTASFATSASQAVSSSFTITASFAQTAQTASYVLNAVSSSFATSASFAVSASRAVTASFSSTASFVTPLNQNVLITGSLNVTQNITGSRMILSASNGTISGSTLTVYGSGSTQPVFTVQGSSGELFSVTDSLSGSLFSVNDISGLPILEVFSDNTTLIGNYLDPMLITTAKVTQTNSGSFVVYSLPTASYDTAFFEYSIKSGSNARAGTIMAIQSGSSVNFTETTTTDFGNTSAVSFTVIVTGSNMALTGSSTTGSWTIKSIVRGL